jgi:hypothetical protein
MGPLVGAAGLVLLARVDADVNYAVDLLPAMLLFALGLAMTVAPLTATVLADADAHNAGIASGVNNAIARVSALITIAAVGTLVAAAFRSRLDGELGRLADRPSVARELKRVERQPLARITPRGLPPGQRAAVAHGAERASVRAFHIAIGTSAALVGLGGVLGLVGIRNPRRRVPCRECPAGQLAGAPAEAARRLHRHERSSATAAASG